MALSVKAYLLILQEQQEIRRFSIDHGASSNFDYLLTKIKTVFPAIRNKPLRLFWKDEDGELVTFSSDEELVEALGSMEGDVFRVYVKISDQQENTEQQATDGGQSASQAEHVGVVCDGCDHGIFGTRFKCAVCPDYDLCMKCERKGLHNEHEMIRICTPRERPGFPGASFAFYGLPPHFPGPHHPPGCPPHHPPGFGPWARGRGSCFRGRPRGGRGRCGGTRGRCGKSAEAKCEQHKEKTTDSTEVPVGPPFLHAMGEAIANLLGPMGVEVHTYADNEKDCCQGKCNCDHSNSKTSTEGNTAESAPENIDQDCQSTTSSSTEKTEENPATEDYVMVDEDKQKEAEKTDAATATETIPDDPLEVAIAQMQSMGFEDHDGWLSRLIVAKEYDIGKVLDAIQYNDKN